MMMSRFFASLATLCAAGALLGGCSSSPRVTYYTLNPMAVTEPAAAAASVDSVAIGPVTLPDLLNRPHFVMRVAPNRVDILEMHRWAEPLKSEIPRIIAENLAVLLKPVRVSAYPQNAGMDAGYRVLVDIQRLDMTAGEGVTLDAIWSVRRTEGGIPKTGRTVVSEPAGAAGYDALVVAQSRALTALSRDIAQALRAVAALPQ
jgi:hypothetical protein